MQRVAIARWPFYVACLVLGIAIFASAMPTRANETIQRQIDQKNEEIKRLEEEARAYEAARLTAEQEAKSLQGQIKSIDASLQRIAANSRVTNAKISRTRLEIQALGGNIAATETIIAENRERLAALVVAIEKAERETPLAAFLKYDSLATMFAAADELGRLEGELAGRIHELRADRDRLRAQQTDARAKEADLQSLAGELADQTTLQSVQRSSRTTLLTETRNQEQRYQELLAEIERKRASLEKEIDTLEASLKPFDPLLVPAARPGILTWPMAGPIVVTQQFGYTAFARSGAYNGNGHNGIDLRAPVGTAIFAAEDGVVRAVGDTDLGCRRASYGKWVLIDHPNNLSTLYAHLSLIKVSPGQAVSRGDTIGLAGATGYATGPHLHFTVFARGSVEVIDYRSRVCGRMMTLPISNAYLDPRDYLNSL
ncbi:hypothetical protein C4552_00350 [Candidatus Parcubacteria bacterium]|nr:MAG: hypothetical protein C4552_00350 [Candidatus Parcubacteria bacterium]